MAIRPASDHRGSVSMANDGEGTKMVTAWCKMDFVRNTGGEEQTEKFKNCVNDHHEYYYYCVSITDTILLLLPNTSQCVFFFQSVIDYNVNSRTAIVCDLICTYTHTESNRF